MLVGWRLKYFNDFQNQNLSTLWLKRTTTMEMKQNPICSMGDIQIWRHIFVYQNILKYFNDFQNQYFSVLLLKWTQAMKMKQNQATFLENNGHETKSGIFPSNIFRSDNMFLSMTFKIKIFQLYDWKKPKQWK